MHKRLLATLVVAAATLSLMGCIVGFPAEQFPAVRKGLRARVGQGEVVVKLKMGWYAGQQAWYITWDTNKLQRWSADSAFWVNPSPVPKLSSAIGAGAARMYVVTNGNATQGPIFSTRPDNDDYSGLWQVFYITWHKGVTPRPIISANDLPGEDEAFIQETDIVKNDPIMAIGPFDGCNWLPAPEGTYRIKQGLCFDVRTKTLILPSWAFFTQDPITRMIYQTEVLITDSNDPAIAELLECNFAPAMTAIDAANTQRLWIFDWVNQPFSPPGQLPIMENTLKNDCWFNSCYNTNYNYSPINELVLVDRTTDSPNFVVNNPPYVQKLIAKGFLTAENSGQRVNVLEVSYWRWTNSWPTIPGCIPNIPGLIPTMENQVR